ncbi:hypothetical protein ABPG72_010894 [Tetrahymena utriculariae]
MNKKLLFELENHYTYHIEAQNLVEKEHACSFLQTGKKSILQDQYICLDCFPSERYGVCKYCIGYCHEGHNIKYFRKSRFFCDCAMLGHKFRQREILIVKDCFLYHIDTNFRKKFYMCPRCNISLCFFCAYDSKHRAHFEVHDRAELRGLESKSIFLNNNQDQLFSSSNLNTSELFMKGKQMKKMKQIVTRIPTTDNLQEYVLTNKNQKCKCDDCTHHRVSRMRSFITRYKQIITQNRLDDCIINPLFNFLFENEAIYMGLFQKFEAHMSLMRTKFTKMGNENQIAQLAEDNSFLDYVFIHDNLQLVNLHNNTKKRFLKLNSKFLNITTTEYIHNIIMNMPNTIQVIDSYSMNWYEKIVEFLMQIYILLIKDDVSQLRKIETKTIENYSPFQRMGIRDFSQHYNQKGYIVLNYQNISKEIKQYIDLISEIDFSINIQNKLLNFSLKIIKAILKCRLISGSKEQAFLKKILNTLNVELQKFTTEEASEIISEKSLVLLSDILVLCFFHQKDLQFETELVDQGLFKRTFQEKLSKNFEGQKIADDMNFPDITIEKKKFYFLYEGDDQNNMNIYKILFGTILNIQMNKKFLDSTPQGFQKIQSNIQKLMREQCVSSTLYIEGIRRCTEESYNSYIILRDLFQKKNVLKEPRKNLDKLIDKYVLGKKITDSFSPAEIIEDLKNQLFDILNQIISTDEYEFFLILINNKTLKTSASYSKSDKKNYPLKLKEFQAKIVRSGIDISIIRLFQYYFFIHPKSSVKTNIHTFRNSSPNYVQPFAVLNKCLDILKVYGYENIDNMAALMQKNNLEIIQKLIDQTDSYLEFSIFYHDLLTSLKEKETFPQPLLIFDHFEHVLDHVDTKYYDVTELSSFLYQNLLRFRINMYESILIIIEKYDSRTKKKEDYYEKSSVLYHCFQSISRNILMIVDEMFDGGLFSKKTMKPHKYIKKGISESLKHVNNKFNTILEDDCFVITANDSNNFTKLKEISQTQEDHIAFKTIQLFAICMKLLNILMENNETIFPQKNIDILTEMFPDMSNSHLSEQTFAFLEELYQDSEYFIDIQTEMFRFFNIHFLKAKNVIQSFEKRNFEMNLLIGSDLKVDKLSTKIFALKSNIQNLEKLLRANIQGFVSKVKIFQKMLKKQLNFLKDFGLYAIFLPFENIISFTKLVGDANFLNGRELMKIQELVIEFIFIRDLFTHVMLKSQIPRNLKQSQANALLEQKSSTPEGKLFGKIEDIFEKYEQRLVNKKYIKIYKKHMSRSSGIVEPKNINPQYYDFYKEIINFIDNLGNKQNESILIEKSPLYQIHYQQIKLKNFCKISSIFMNYILNQIKQPSALYPYSKLQSCEYYNYNSMCNHVKLMNRLLILDTTLFQGIIREYLEESLTNKDLFVSILQIVAQYMPQLFSLVKNYETNFEDNTLRWIGDLSVEFIQLFRYLAEEQHEYLQKIIGEQGILRRMIGLCELLFKSWQIDTLTSKKAQAQLLMEGGISQTFIKLFTYSMIGLAEMHLGPCLENQNLTIQLFNQQKMWQIITKILIKKATSDMLTLQTVRVYVLELVISLLEGQNNYILENISSVVNYKVLEETFLQTFKHIVKTFLNIEINESSQDNTNLYFIPEKLIQIYKYQLGENLHQSVLLDEKNQPIKILVSISKILNNYKKISQEVSTYVNFYKKRISDPANYRTTYNGIITTGFKFLDGIVQTIELVDSLGNLIEYQYIIPPQCFFLSYETQNQFLENVDRSNNGSKLGSMIDAIPHFMIEMEENRKFFKNYSPLWPKLLQIVMFDSDHSKPVILLAVINFIITIFVSFSYKIEDGQVVREHTTFVKVLGKLNVYLSTIILSFYLLLRSKIYYRIDVNELQTQQNIANKEEYKKQDSKENKMRIQIQKILLIYSIFKRKDLLPFFLILILSLCGIYISEFFFYLLCLCFVFVNKTMNSVLQALKMRWRKFLGIFLLILFLLNMYAFTGFTSFSQRFQLNVLGPQGEYIDEQLCDTPYHCLISLVLYGLREDNGIGTFGYNMSFANSNYDFYTTFIFDFSFFIIISQIMLNVISGIIIDAFADLRDEQHQTEFDIENVCFICDIQKWEFEKNGFNFARHTTKIHNIWNYVNFLVYLNILGRENANGTETYVMNQNLDSNKSWIPNQKTLEFYKK